MASEGTGDSLLVARQQGVKAKPESARDEWVVECAAQLFLEGGLSSVKMTDIADASGVGVATLYRRFKSKTRLSVEAATLLWKRFNERICELVESDDFLTMNGADRLETLLREYGAHYVANREFVSFLDEFDHLVLSEGVEGGELESYGREVDSFYIIFDDAYKLGVSDGSVLILPDFATFYKSVAHALVSVAEKMARGEVIHSDDFSDGMEELDCIVDMAVKYVRK